MTLNDFCNMSYTKDCERNVVFTVFDDEDLFDTYIEDPGERDAKLFTLDSAYIVAAILLPKYAKAQVKRFCAVGSDKIYVIIDVETQKGE